LHHKSTLSPFIIWGSMQNPNCTSGL